MDIKKNNVIQKLDTWGPDYKVEFSIRVINTPDVNNEYNILHITDDQNQYPNLLVSAINGSLHISSADENVIFEYQYETSYEYDIIIQQSGKLYIQQICTKPINCTSVKMYIHCICRNLCYPLWQPKL